MALGAADGVTAVATSEATDVTADESVVTADGAAGDTHASASSCVTGVDVEPAAMSPVAATYKRKGRGKGNNVARDERKRLRRANSLLSAQGNTEAGT